MLAVRDTYLRDALMLAVRALRPLRPLRPLKSQNDLIST